MSEFNGYLLDTNVLVWLDADPQRISATVYETLQASQSRIWVSAASVWEIAIKIAIGKMAVNTPLPTLIQRHGFIELPVTARYMNLVAGLPHHHGDPFDRLLVAQAHLESLVLVTADRRLAAYNVPTLLVE